MSLLTDRFSENMIYNIFKKYICVDVSECR